MEKEIASIVVAATGLVGVAGILIKFTVDSVFKSLQEQINGLRADAERKDKELERLRKELAEWRDKYNQLYTEHITLQTQFDVHRGKIVPEGIG